MKNFKYLSLVCVFFWVGISVANAGINQKEFKNYTITPADQFEEAKRVEKVWTLAYNSSEKPLTVVKHDTSGGAEYVVKSDFFEISYALTSKGFGTKRVKNAWSTVPPQINDVVINWDKLANQKVITHEKLSDEDALELIACYLPELINESYIHLLN